MTGKDSQEPEFDSEDFAKYVELLKTTGKLKSDKLTDNQTAQLKADYGRWVEDGRPKPKMPEPRKESSPIEKVYRRNVFGEEKISWITKDGIHHGLEVTPIYGTIKDNVTGEDIEDPNVTIGVDKHFTEKYTDAKAKEIMAIAFKTCPNPKFYLVDGGLKVGLRNPKKNFFGNLQETMSKAVEGKLVF